MAGRHSDDDASDTFWPGYVDAVTNLVLNLLFLLTIMIVAVFMFALELGRSSKGGVDKSLVSSSKQGSATAIVERATADPVQENIALKREVERLTRELAQRSAINPSAGVQAKTVDATSSVPKPENGLDKSLADDFEVIVRFTDDAVSLTPAERERLLQSLKPIVASGQAKLQVEVPAGFSEAKRMGFYRAMAVRNLLLEMALPKEKIDVTVVEGKGNANASLVKVK